MANVTIEILSNNDRLLEARRLQGQRFVDAGFVSELNADGVIDDEWVPISTYFGAIAANGAVVGVARLIPNSAAGLPALQEFRLSDAGSEVVDGIEPRRLVEVSALAIARGQGFSRSSMVADHLYRAMYQHSVVTAEYTHWCAALDVRVKRHLVSSRNFLLLEEIGEEKDYLGSPTVPVLLDLLEQARHSARTSPSSTGFFASGLVIDIRGEDVNIEVGSAEFVPHAELTFARE